MYEDPSEFFEETERPSVPFRPIDALILIVDFLDDIVSAFHGLTSKVLWKVAAHSNHTLDREAASSAVNSAVEII